MTFTPTYHVIGNKSPSLPHRSRLTRGGILGCLQFKLGIYLGTQQNDVELDVKPEQQNDDRAKRAVKLIVVGEVRYVE